MGVWTGTLPTLAAGDFITDSALIGDIMGILAALTDPWTPYTVDWTASSSNPDIDDGILTGEYRQLGADVEARGIMVAAAGTSFGSGTYRLNYPVTPSSIASTFGGVIGILFVADFGTAQYVGEVVSSTTDYMQLITSPTTVTANNVTPTVPFTFGTGDRFSWYVKYRAG